MLELLSLSRRYGDMLAMDELSFTVRSGEVVGFLGPNGAGKTTAMRSVLGITRPDSGEVRWNDSRIEHEQRLRFGYMPEERGLYGTMGVLDQLVYIGRLHGMDKTAARASSIQWLETLGLADRREDKLEALSMGNQQRIQLASALVHQPELLVLDEPFSGLDPTGIEALSNVLAERAREGAAVVFSSHQLDLVEDLCERVVIINKGRTVVEGRTDELTMSDTTVVVRIAGVDTSRWVDGLEGVHVEHVEHGEVRLSLDEPSRADAVLTAARDAGPVRTFSFERRRLSEVFREAVA